ncbi:hypothetical protein [Candidatus Nitrosocosmicus sp. R]
MGEQINVYDYQKRDLLEKIGILEQKRQSIIVLHNTFMKLDKILWEDCEIDLKKDLESFTKLFSDFKENGYDVTSIVAEYNKAVKLRWDIAQNETQIRDQSKRLAILHSDISFHQSILDAHKKNFEIYKQLETMKFGIDDLQQLWLTVSEIARDIGDPLKDFDMIEDPVLLFLLKMSKKTIMTNSNLKTESRKKEMNWYW